MSLNSVKTPKPITDSIRSLWISTCFAYFTHLQWNYVLWKCPVLHCFANTSQIDAKNSCTFRQFLKVLYNQVGGGGGGVKTRAPSLKTAVRSSTLMHFSVFWHISACGTWNCIVLWLNIWTTEFGSCVFNVFNLLFFVIKLHKTDLSWAVCLEVWWLFNHWSIKQVQH